jgi:hypothetical protein
MAPSAVTINHLKTKKPKKKRSRQKLKREMQKCTRRNVENSRKRKNSLNEANKYYQLKTTT